MKDISINTNAIEKKTSGGTKPDGKERKETDEKKKDVEAA